MDGKEQILNFKTMENIPKSEKKRVRKALRTLPILLSIIHEDNGFCVVVLSKSPFTVESQKIFVDGMNEIYRKMDQLVKRKTKQGNIHGDGLYENSDSEKIPMSMQ